MNYEEKETLDYWLTGTGWITISYSAGTIWLRYRIERRDSWSIESTYYWLTGTEGTTTYELGYRSYGY